MNPSEQLEWWRGELGPDGCYVYVIQMGRTGPIKVGVAKDVHARTRTLQTGNPYPLRLLRVLPGAHELEWQLHRKLPGRSRLIGEWFDGDEIPAFLAFVDDLARRMMDAYQGNGIPPSWKPLATWIATAKSPTYSTCTTRYVDPETLKAGSRRWKRGPGPGDSEYRLPSRPPFPLRPSSHK